MSHIAPALHQASEGKRLGISRSRELQRLRAASRGMSALYMCNTRAHVLYERRPKLLNHAISTQ